MKQSVLPDEIIVVDNGSTDNTKKMIKKEFDNIIYLFHDKKGVSIARNVGIQFATKELICFLDSDDEWNSKKIEKQVNFFLNNKNCKFLHTDEIWFRNGNHLNQLKKHLKEGGHIFENCLKICCISPSSVMMHKSLFEEHGLFDEKLKVCEDYEMWLRISSCEEIFFLQDKLVVKHGGHCDQLSKKYWGMDRFRIKSLEKNLKNNWFTSEQKKSVFNTLIKKLSIISNGAKKRDNEEIYKKYSKKLNYWSLELDKYKNE